MKSSLNHMRHMHARERPHNTPTHHTFAAADESCTPLQMHHHHTQCANTRRHTKHTQSNAHHTFAIVFSHPSVCLA